MEEKEKETFKEHVRKLVTPIFDKILGTSTGNEENTMGVDKNKEKEITNLITFYWRPNNYRLQIPFNREKLNLGTDITPLIKKRKGSVVKTPYGNIKVSNFGSKISCKINRFPVMLDKNSITITYSLKIETLNKKFKKEIKKAIYKIEAENIGDIDKKIKEKVEEIKKVCIETTERFIKKYGGEADFSKAKFIAHEDGIHAEDWMPEEEIIYDTNFKKVYKNEIELKSPLLVKNYISNRVVEEIAPDIAREIKNNNDSIEDVKEIITIELKPVLKKLTKQIELHLEVQRETGKTLKEIRKPFFIRWWNYFKEKWKNKYKENLNEE